MRSRPASRLLIALLLAATPAAAARVEVDCALEPPAIGIDEAATFWIEVSTSAAGSPRFAPDFTLDNLEVLGNPGRSESFRFVNGVTSRTFRLTWRLRPLGLGPAAVRDIRVRVGEEVLEIADRRLEVLEQPPPGRRPPAAGPSDWDPFDLFGRLRSGGRGSRALEPEVFLAAEAQPRRPYVGQQVTYSLYLYTQTEILSVHPKELPEFAGFWAQEIPLEHFQPEAVELDGQRYGRVALLKRILFPRRSGRFEIPPAEYDLVAQVPGRSFFRPALPRRVQLTRRNEALEIEVAPLPPGPEDFAGAVGSFSLEGELIPRRVAVGEAATLTLRLTGNGHVQSLPAPRLAEPEGLTVFPPEGANQQELDGDRLRGERTWSFVLVPQEQGTWYLPPVEIPFYDPRVESYRVALSPGFELSAVDRGAAAGDDPPASLHPIRNAAVPVDRGVSWKALLPWLFALPFALTLALRLRRRRTGIEGSAAGRRLLAALDGIGAADTPRQVASRLENAWRRFLAERWEVAEELPPARWAEQLTSTAGPAAAELERLAADLHYLRFAPQLSTAGPLIDELLDHSRRLARRLS